MKEYKLFRQTGELFLILFYMQFIEENKLFLNQNNTRGIERI
jgi:hypothetical protein